MILVVLDCIKFKLFVMLLCHNEILLQHVSIVPCLYIFGTSHFDLYYLYSSTNHSNSGLEIDIIVKQLFLIGYLCGTADG